MNTTPLKIVVRAIALLVAAVAPAWAQPARAGAPRPTMLVSAAWLSEHLRDANLVVLQVGNEAQFDSVHIPGARPVALSDISLAASESKLSLELPPPARLKAWAEAQGIGNTTRIVVVPYDSVLQSSTRVFLTLAYMGAMDRTSLLNGGLRAWIAEARPVSNEAPPVARSTEFDLALRPELLAAMGDVEAAIQSNRVSIVDARLPRFFNGDGGGYPRAGHIPTARNIPLTAVSTNGFLNAEPALRQLFTGSGVQPGAPVITYCHIGQQGSLLWFVATMLGYDAQLYDGSFQEWSGTERLPVVGKP